MNKNRLLVAEAIYVSSTLGNVITMPFGTITCFDVDQTHADSAVVITEDDFETMIKPGASKTETIPIQLGPFINHPLRVMLSLCRLGQFHISGCTYE